MSTAHGRHQDQLRWIAVRAGGLALGTGVLLFLCGCPYVAAITTYQQRLSDWLADAENWPDASVRIVNHTDAVASVYLVSAGLAPPAPTVPGYPGGTYYQPVETRSVLIDPGGTATGTLKCGDVLAVSVKAPLDVDASSVGYTSYEEDEYGLYLDAGNCVLTGAGIAQTAFSGDTVTLVRYVRPADDGLDCAAQTLVIAIETAGTPSVVDPDTGEIVRSARLGAATVSIE